MATKTQIIYKIESLKQNILMDYDSMSETQKEQIIKRLDAVM